MGSIEVFEVAFSYADLYGQRFGELVVIADGPQLSNDYSWHCQCSCGRSVVRRHADLLQSNLGHCGCKNNYKKREKQTQYA